MITLNATKREETGKASRRLRAQGKMPAIVYGPDHAAEPITVSISDFAKILRDQGESTVVDVAGLGAGFQALIKAIDHDPVTGEPRHADLYAITKGAKVTVAVQLVFVGDSAAEKEGASIVKVVHELEVEADPSSLPHEIEVNVELLAKVGDQIHLKDVKLPKGVVATGDPDDVIALAQTIEQEPEESADVAPDMANIEVEQKGKSDDEGAGESSDAAAE